MTDEEWRVIPGFPEYACSNMGNIKRIIPDKKGRLTGKNLRQPIRPDGYRYVYLTHDGKKTNKTVHRLICRAFHGEAPAHDSHAAHRNGIKVENFTSNLKWATPKENTHDRYAHGTMRYDNVIRKFFHKKYGSLSCTRAKLMLVFGINQGCMCELIKGRRNSAKGWKLNG